jgi:hypothetical protein
LPPDIPIGNKGILMTFMPGMMGSPKGNLGKNKQRYPKSPGIQPLKHSREKQYGDLGIYW